jgi:hypothetical protein
MARRKSGPKGVIENPQPIKYLALDGALVVSPNEVGGEELDDSERRLRSALRQKRAELVQRPKETLSAAVARITRLVTDALTETNAAAWSGYASELEVDNPDAFQAPSKSKDRFVSLDEIDKTKPQGSIDRAWNPPSLRRASRPCGRGGARRHIGPTAPNKAEDKCLWLDTSKIPATLRRYSKGVGRWKKFIRHVDSSIAADDMAAGKFVVDMTRTTQWLLQMSWPRVTVTLRPFVEQMLKGQMGRAGKSGRQAYLAYATLGVLLDETPEKISDLLNNYRRKPNSQVTPFASLGKSRS